MNSHGFKYLLIFLLLAGGCTSLDTRLNRSIRKQLLKDTRKTAVLKGIRWLADKSNRISPKTTAINIKKIYKVTPDEDLAKKLAKVIRKNEKNIIPVDPAIDINNEKYHNWFALRPVVETLLRKKCADTPISRDAEKVRKLLSRYWKKIFPQKMILSQKLVAAYLLKELGVCTPAFYQSVILQIRSRSKMLEDPSKPGYLYYLYALTHSVFTRSDYYNRYLDKDEFSFEIRGMYRAIDRLLSSPDLSDNGADILAEMLICLKLLKIPPEPRARKAFTKLLEKQNPDGSWGSEKEPPTARSHHTVVSVLALMAFAPEFRRGKIYCRLN